MKYQNRFTCNKSSKYFCFFFVFANEFPFFQIPTNQAIWLDTRHKTILPTSKDQWTWTFFIRKPKSIEQKREMNRKESPNGQWSMECIRFKKMKIQIFHSSPSYSRVYGIIKPWYHPQFAIIGCHFISIINQFSNWPRNWCGEIVDIYGKKNIQSLNAIHYSRISISIRSHQTQSDTIMRLDSILRSNNNWALNVDKSFFSNPKILICLFVPWSIIISS